jgi:hypothetical protein
MIVESKVIENVREIRRIGHRDILLSGTRWLPYLGGQRLEVRLQR